MNKNVDKLTDKAFMRLLITSVLSIVVCVVCLCSGTWAWFTESQASSNNTIKSAQCLLEISLDDGTDETENIIIKYEDGKQTLRLLKDVDYKVTLEIPADSSSGYCKIGASSNAEITYYFSDSVTNKEENRREVVFNLKVAEDMEVVIIPCWGIYCGDADIDNGASIILAPDGSIVTDGTETETTADTEA